MSENGRTDESQERPKIIDLNECLSASALEEKIANHAGAADDTKRFGAAPPDVDDNGRRDTQHRGENNAAEFGGDGNRSSCGGGGADNIDRMQALATGGGGGGGGGVEERREAEVEEEKSKAHFVGGKLEYCICRKPDINRFMIGCDQCNEWFHGDCIGILEIDARSIKRWYCLVCRSKDSSLVVVFKSKQQATSSPPPARHRDREKQTKKSKRCGECGPCHEKRDCGLCDYCRDMKKFGGPFKRRQKCRQRQCLHLGKGSSKSSKHKYRSDDGEDFFVGDADGGEGFESEDGLFTGEEDNQDDDDDRIPRAGKSYEFDPDFRPVKKKKNPNSSAAPKPGRPRKIESTEGRGGFALEGSVGIVDDEPRKKTLKLKNVETPKSGSLAPPSSSSDLLHRSSSSKNRDKGKDKDRKTKKTKKNGRGYRSGSGNDLFANSFLFDSGVEHQDIVSQEEPREEVFSQCFGPGCTLASRNNSKYCSDDCGLKLATHRLCELLPQRIQQWRASSCTAEELDMKKLEKVRQSIGEKSKRLSELDRKYKALDAIVDRAKSYKADPDYDPEDEEETEMMFYCVTCGHEVNVRRAATHMERCFTRFESQTSFGTLHKTNMDGQSFFCDVYNKESNTYCKRLRVICPEHFKDKKVEPNDVCGCPLTKGLFEETSNLCKAPKKKCQNHINWERLRRAEIDMERVGDLMELEELYEEERSIRQGMASRAGVLGLMLHSTIDHDTLARQMQAQQRQQQQLQQQQQQQQQLLQRETVKPSR